MAEMFFQIPVRELTWRAQEVVRVVDHKPHLVVRITVTGGHFPQRALVPFIRVMEGEKVVARDWFTEIGEDGSLIAYFQTDMPKSGVLEYGYFPEILGRISLRFNANAIQRLDRKRLAKDVVDATSKYLRKKNTGQ